MSKSPPPDAATAAARQSWSVQLEQTPWAFDFYQVLRRYEAWHPDSARFGESRRLAEDPVRLGQSASMTFAPANVERVTTTRSGRTRISVRFLGLFGPQGPLPSHLTDVARSREYSHGDETLARFADLFHHRQLSMFYRAWRQAQPTANRDRSGEDRFMTYLGALIGEAGAGWQGRDSLGDPVKRHFAGILADGRRNADGLVAILGRYFGVPVSLEPFAARWMTLPPDQRSRIGGEGVGARLGSGAVLGKRVYDAQHHIRLHLGPLTLAQFENFLPGAPWHVALRDWVRRYGDEVWAVAVTLRLAATQVPSTTLGSAGRLGWTSWLGRRPGHGPAEDLTLMVSQVAS